jgi:hypothetical protein
VLPAVTPAVVEVVLLLLLRALQDTIMRRLAAII